MRGCNPPAPPLFVDDEDRYGNSMKIPLFVDLVPRETTDFCGFSISMLLCLRLNGKQYPTGKKSPTDFRQRMKSERLATAATWQQWCWAWVMWGAATETKIAHGVSASLTHENPSKSIQFLHETNEPFWIRDPEIRVPENLGRNPHTKDGTYQWYYIYLYHFIS